MGRGKSWDVIQGKLVLISTVCFVVIWLFIYSWNMLCNAHRFHGLWNLRHGRQVTRMPALTSLQIASKQLQRIRILWHVSGFVLCVFSANMEQWQGTDCYTSVHVGSSWKISTRWSEQCINIKLRAELGESTSKTLRMLISKIWNLNTKACNGQHQCYHGPKTHVCYKPKWRRWWLVLCS